MLRRARPIASGCQARATTKFNRQATCHLAEAPLLGKVSRMTRAIASAPTIATINGRAAYCESSRDLGSIPASIPKPMRTPGLLIMIPPTRNMMPFTIAAEVPIRLGVTTSAAVLKASM
jgi:hypothetical protein